MARRGPLVVEPSGSAGPVYPAAGTSGWAGLEYSLGTLPHASLNSSLCSWESHMEFHQETFHLPFGQTGQTGQCSGWAEDMGQK